MADARRWLAPLALVVPTGSAYAFYDLPTLNPPAPVEGQEISIDIRAGGCHLFDGDPRDAVVTRNGNQIALTMPALFNGFCIFPTRTRPYVVGTFPAGSYTLDVYYQLAWVSGGGPPRCVGQLSFDIAPRGVAVETPIPALSGLSKIILTLGSMALAFRYTNHVSSSPANRRSRVRRCVSWHGAQG